MSLLRRRTAMAVAAVALLSAMLGLACRRGPLLPPAAPIRPSESTRHRRRPAVDETVDVSIVITDVTGLYSASVDLTFDPAVLEVVDADPGRSGVQIFTGTFPGPSEGPGDVT